MAYGMVFKTLLVDVGSNYLRLVTESDFHKLGECVYDHHHGFVNGA